MFHPHSPHSRGCSQPLFGPQRNMCTYEITSQDLVHQSLIPGDVTRWVLPLPGSLEFPPSKHPSLPNAATLRAVLRVGALPTSQSLGHSFPFCFPQADLAFHPAPLGECNKARAGAGCLLVTCCVWCPCWKTCLCHI